MSNARAWETFFQRIQIRWKLHLWNPKTGHWKRNGGVFCAPTGSHSVENHQKPLSDGSGAQVREPRCTVPWEPGTMANVHSRNVRSAGPQTGRGAPGPPTLGRNPPSTGGEAREATAGRRPCTTAWERTRPMPPLQHLGKRGPQRTNDLAGLQWDNTGI